MSEDIPIDADTFVTQMYGECPFCAQWDPFQHVWYSRDADDATLASIAQGTFGVVKCSKCERSIDIKFPHVYFAQRHKLVIYVAHRDGNDVIREYKESLARVGTVLPSSEFTTLRQTPFTLVNGWKGLHHLVRILNSFPRTTDDDSPKWGEPAVGQIEGHPCPPLFFYRASSPRVHALESGSRAVAEQYRKQDEVEVAYAVLQYCAGVVDSNDPWTFQELGTLALKLGRLQEAEGWYQKALSAQATWLVPTLSFVDATEKSRRLFGFEPNEKVTPIQQNRVKPIETVRHAVAAFFPPRHEDGWWFFPDQMKAVEPRIVGDHIKWMVAYGGVLGQIEHAIDRFGWDECTVDIFTAFARLGQQATELDLKYQQDQDGRSGFEQLTREYAIRRWSLPTDADLAANSGGLEDRERIARTYGAAEGRIGMILTNGASVPEEVEEVKIEPAASLLKTYFLPERVLAWSVRAQHAIAGMAREFLDNCSDSERPKLTRAQLEAFYEAHGYPPGAVKISVGGAE